MQPTDFGAWCLCSLWLGVVMDRMRRQLSAFSSQL
jgi:hypothetical protein